MAQGTKIFLIGVASQFLIVIQSCAQTTPRGLPVVFAASTPCSAGTKPLPGIPREAGCALMKWELKLYSMKETSGNYVLDGDYGLAKQGTRGLIHGGTHLHREGKWIVTKGRGANPSAIIYRLDPDKPHESVSFLRLDENLIHLLDSDQQLMTGTGAWSYTLNKIQR